MTNHLKGLLMTIFAVVILSPDSVLIRLVEEASSEVDSWTVLFWRGSALCSWSFSSRSH